MSRALFLSFIKTQGRTIVSYAFGAVLYEWLLIWIYPSIAKSSVTNQLLQSMPAALLKAFGMQNGFQQLGDYLASEFYGLIYLLILAVFCVTMAIQLVARLVDRGSMAYLLATKASRARVVTTQAMVLLTGLFVICACTTLGGLTGVAVFVKQPSSLPIGSFVHINVIGFLRFALLSGFSFLCSCIFDDERRALGVAAVVTVVSYALHLVSTLSDKLQCLRVFSIFTAFDPGAVMRRDEHVIPTEVALAVGTVVLFVIAIQWFKRRNLQL